MIVKISGTNMVTHFNLEGFNMYFVR